MRLRAALHRSGVAPLARCSGAAWHAQPVARQLLPGCGGCGGSTGGLAQLAAVFASSLRVCGSDGQARSAPSRHPDTARILGARGCKRTFARRPFLRSKEPVLARSGSTGAVLRWGRWRWRLWRPARTSRSVLSLHGARSASVPIAAELCASSSSRRRRTSSVRG